MANIYKNIQAKITSAGSYDDMYTAPAETTSIIKSIKLYNTHGSNLVVDIKVYDLSSTTDFEYDTVTVDASGSVDLLTFNLIFLCRNSSIFLLQICYLLYSFCIWR